jgi:hypothetical protein
MCYNKLQILQALTTISFISTIAHTDSNFKLYCNSFWMLLKLQWKKLVAAATTAYNVKQHIRSAETKNATAYPARENATVNASQVVHNFFFFHLTFW